MTDKQWVKDAEKAFLGKTIVGVRYMTQAECDEMGWRSRPLVLALNDGNLIWPSRDDEGNDAGALFCNDEPGCFPVL
jgi:hypothetical protein